MAVGPATTGPHEIADGLAAADPRRPGRRQPGRPYAARPQPGHRGGPARHHGPGRRARRAGDGYIAPGRRAAGRDRRGQRRRRDGRPGHDAVRAGGRLRLHHPARPRRRRLPPGRRRRPARPRPSSSACSDKAELLAVGGFDETMHRAQDWELNYRLRQSRPADLVLPGAPGDLPPAVDAEGADQADVRHRQVAARGRPPAPRHRQRALPGAAGGRGRHRRRHAGRAVLGRWHRLPAAAARLRRPRRLRRAVVG